MSNTQLPAHLLKLFNANPDLARVGENIKSEGAHAKVKFNGKKWRLISATGDETIVKPFWLTDQNGQPVNPPQAINGIDVIIVDINENKSHVVYEKNYNRDEEAAPLWSSDDGTPVPVELETKVVSDHRRIAVLWADNPEQGLYELRIASKSLTPFAKYRTAIGNAGVPIGSVVTRITFDDAYDYPVLSFAPTAYITEAQANSLEKAATAHKEEVKALIGLGGKARAAIAAIAGPQPSTVSMLVTPSSSNPVENTATIAAPRRSRKATILPSTEPVTNVVPMPSQPVTAAAAVVTKPASTSADIDALLNNIMGKK